MGFLKEVSMATATAGGEVKTLLNKLRRASGDEAANLRAKLRRLGHKGGLRSVGKK